MSEAALPAAGFLLAASLAAAQSGLTEDARVRGRLVVNSTGDGVPLDNVVEVPPDYTPSRMWPVRVSLHGGVGRPAPGPGDSVP